MTESENFRNRSELLSVTENENYYKFLLMRVQLFKTALHNG